MIDFYLVAQDKWYPKICKDTIIDLFTMINDRFGLVNHGFVYVSLSEYEKFEFSFKNSVIATLEVTSGTQDILEFKFHLPLNDSLLLPFETNYCMTISPQLIISCESWSRLILSENHIYSAGIDLYPIKNSFEYYSVSNYLFACEDLYIKNNNIVEIVKNTLDYNNVIEIIKLSYNAHKRPDAFFEIFQEKDFKVALQKPMLNDKIEALQMILI